MEDHDVHRSRVIGHANPILGDVFPVVERDDGRQGAREKVETPDGNLTKTLSLSVSQSSQDVVLDFETGQRSVRIICGKQGGRLYRTFS